MAEMLRIHLGGIPPEELDSQQSESQQTDDAQIVAPAVRGEGTKRKTITWTDDHIKSAIDAVVSADPSNKVKNKAANTTEMVRWAAIAAQLVQNKRGLFEGSELSGPNLKAKINTVYIDWQGRYHAQGVNKSCFNGDMEDKANYTLEGSKPYMIGI